MSVTWGSDASQGSPARWRAIPVTVLLLLQVADALTTRAALAHGAVELNPLVRVVGLWPAKAVVAAALLALVWRGKARRAVVALCVVYGLIVLNNLAIALR